MFFYYMKPLYLYYCAQRAITVLCVKEWLEYLEIFSKPTKKVLFLYISPCWQKIPLVDMYGAYFSTHHFRTKYVLRSDRRPNLTVPG